jgi:hypothetical protein
MSRRDSSFDVVSVSRRRNSFGVPTYSANLLGFDSYVNRPSTASSLKTSPKYSLLANIPGIGKAKRYNEEAEHINKTIDLIKEKITPEIEKILDSKIIDEARDAHNKAIDARLAYKKEYNKYKGYLEANNNVNNKKKIDDVEIFMNNLNQLKKKENIANENEEKKLKGIRELVQRAEKKEAHEYNKYLKNDGKYIEAYKNSGTIVDEIKRENEFNRWIEAQNGGAKRPVAKRPTKTAIKRPTTKRPIKPIAKRPVKKPTAVRAKRPVAKRPVAKRPVRAVRVRK